MSTERPRGWPGERSTSWTIGVLRSVPNHLTWYAWSASGRAPGPLVGLPASQERVLSAVVDTLDGVKVRPSWAIQV
jgi:hypothetical protein